MTMFHETKVWRDVVACEYLGVFKRNEIACNLQRVLDNADIKFSPDKPLIAAFVWDRDRGEHKYWSNLHDVLMRQDDIE